MTSNRQIKGKSLVAARLAKMERRHRRMAATSKRTSIGQSIGKEAYEIETKQMNVTIAPASFKPTTKKPIKRISAVAKRKTKSFIKPITNPKWQYVSEVISGRQRIHPMAQQPMDMPQGAQDVAMHSEVIKAWRYSKERLILDIEFVNGGIWRYYKVKPDIILGLKIAGIYGSVGRYFHRMIRLKYNDTRVG